MKKRVERAETKWLAVGTSERGWVFFTEKPVIEDSHSVSEDKIRTLVPFALRGPYTFNERRVRHSEGLFPSYHPSPEIEGYVVVKENVKTVRGKLEREGYIDSSKRKKVKSGDSDKPDAGTGWVEANMIDDILKNKWFTVLKKEGV